jgi:hypothetical protein
VAFACGREIDPAYVFPEGEGGSQNIAGSAGAGTVGPDISAGGVGGSPTRTGGAAGAGGENSAGSTSAAGGVAGAGGIENVVSNAGSAGSAGQGGSAPHIPKLAEEAKFYPGLETWGFPFGGVLVHSLCPLGEVVVGAKINTKFDPNNNLQPVSFVLRCAPVNADGSLGTSRLLSQTAGNGVFSSTTSIECPPNQVSIGVNGYLAKTTSGASYISSFGLSCAPFVSWMSNVKALTLIGPVGTVSSEPFADSCPDGWGVMKGFSSRVGAFLDALRVRCVEAR